MIRPGKTVACLLFLASAVVVVATAVAFHERILEEWYLWRLEVGDRVEKEDAAAKLGAFGAARAVPMLFELLGEEQPDDPLSGIQAGARTPIVFTPPGPIVDSELEIEPTGPFADALRSIALPDHPGALVHLVAAVEREHGALRRFAIDLLKPFGAGAEPAVPALRALLAEPAWRGVAAGALGEIGPAAKAAIPGLLDLLDQALPDDDGEPDASKRWMSCGTSVNLGDFVREKEARKKDRQNMALTSGFSWVGNLPVGVEVSPDAIRAALMKIASGAPQELFSAMEGRRWRLTKHVAELLHEKTGARVFLRALESEKPFVRRLAVWFLGRHGEGQDLETLRELAKAKHDSDPMVRDLAVASLRMLEE